MEIKNNLIQFNKLEIQNIILKFENQLLQIKNRRLKLKIKKLKARYEYKTRKNNSRD